MHTILFNASLNVYFSSLGGNNVKGKQLRQTKLTTAEPSPCSFNTTILVSETELLFKKQESASNESWLKLPAILLDNMRIAYTMMCSALKPMFLQCCIVNTVKGPYFDLHHGDTGIGCIILGNRILSLNALPLKLNSVRSW